MLSAVLCLGEGTEELCF